MCVRYGCKWSSVSTHAVIGLQGRTGVEVCWGEGLTAAEKAGRWALGWWWAFVVETASQWVKEKKSFGDDGECERFMFVLGEWMLAA